MRDTIGMMTKEFVCRRLLLFSSRSDANDTKLHRSIYRPNLFFVSKRLSLLIQKVYSLFLIIKKRTSLDIGSVCGSKVQLMKWFVAFRLAASHQKRKGTTAVGCMEFPRLFSFTVSSRAILFFIEIRLSLIRQVSFLLFTYQH